MVQLVKEHKDIIESLDDIITKDPKAFIGLHNQMCNSQTLNLIKKILLLLAGLCNQLKQMRDNSQRSLLKSFNGCNTVLARIYQYNQQNVIGYSTRKQ